MSYEIPSSLGQRIQANILKPHNRKFVAFLFFRWPANQPPLRYRVWVREMAKAVTSYDRQLTDSLDYKEALKNGVNAADVPQAFAINLGLTHQAYEQMKLLHAQPLDPLLKTGMEGDDFFSGYNSGLHVDDPLAIFFRARIGHEAMMSIAHDKITELNTKLEAIKSAADRHLPGIKILVKQIEPNRAVTALGTQKGEALGPFGFRDGISNPHSLEQAAQFAFGTSSLADLQNRPKLGTYLALQKIICRVGKFKSLTRQLRDVINASTITKITTTQAEAMLVGRHRNGAPLDRFAKPPIRSLSAAELNEFDYRDVNQAKLDLAGTRCPLHAHTRRVNPRQDGQIKPIIRRGVTYLERNSKGRWQQSLLFLSMQSSLKDNLLPLYQCMFKKEPKDAVTYKKPNGGLILAPLPMLKYYSKYNDHHSKIVEFEHSGGQVTSFVTGAFYYLPGLNFLQQL